MSAKKKPAKPANLVSLTARIKRSDYVRFCVLRAKTGRNALDLLEEAILKMLHDAGV
jgi:hypothetical protein